MIAGVESNLLKIQRTLSTCLCKFIQVVLLVVGDASSSREQ